MRENDDENDGLIFLDMGGVITTTKDAMIDGLVNNRFPVEVPNRQTVECIATFAKRWDAKVVISSSWRKIHSLAFFEGYFIGTEIFRRFHRNWKTPNSRTGFRGDEILDFLRSEYDDDDSYEYVIIDDESDFHDSQKPHLIKTDIYNGLKIENVFMMQDILSLGYLTFLEKNSKNSYRMKKVGE